jgi:hypothetical protein
MAIKQLPFLHCQISKKTITSNLMGKWYGVVGNKNEMQAQEQPPPSRYPDHQQCHIIGKQILGIYRCRYPMLY